MVSEIVSSPPAPVLSASLQRRSTLLSLWPSVGLSLLCPHFSYSGWPRTGPRTSDVASPIEGKDHFPLCVGSTLPNTFQDMIFLLSGKRTLLARVELGAPPGPPCPFLESCFPAGSPSMSWCLGQFFPRYRQDSALLLAEHHDVLASPPPQPVRAPLDGSIALQ